MPGRDKMRATAVALLLGLLLIAPPSGGPVQAQSASSTNDDAAGRALTDLAVSKGALGVYLDRARATYVVAVPDTNPSAFTRKDAQGLGVDVTIEPRDIDQATLAAITSRLESKQSKEAASFTYGYGLNLRTGLVEILAEGSEDAFADVVADFPGKTEFHPAEFFNAAMHDDTAPFAGGAYQNGDLNCTSGFTMKWANGTKRMITAGHCFHNVGSTQTNMGQGSISGAGGWPDYDIGQISGSTYEGWIWTSSDRKVKVSDGANPVVGGSYCTSGRSSGVVCNWEVTQLGVTICFSGMPACFKSLAAFKRFNDAHIIPGDSGGPLWVGTVGDGGQLRAGVRGVISGYFWDINTFSWRSYATQYNRIVTEFGGSADIPS
jgi:hypothetical protein